uniref:solute carrier family 2, facilitated glucose transporter member 11-like n=1 Tax=Myxine glutinosa TaxID=7769 RepID=UPI00358E5FFE
MALVTVTHGQTQPRSLTVKETAAGPTSKLPPRHLLLLASATGIGGTFQYGFNISVMNAPTWDIKNFINNTYCERHSMFIDDNLVTLLWSVMVSIYTAGGALGSFLTGPLASKLGRKKALLANNSLALLAAVIMGVSYPLRAYELIILGRFVIGMNCGLGLNLQPMYLGETAPQHLRGVMSMCGMIFLPLGIMVGQVVGLPEILGRPGGWPLILSVTAIPALLQIFTLPSCPESPRFLLIDKNDVDECRKALKWLGGKHMTEMEMENEMAGMREEHALIGDAGMEKSALVVARDPTLRRALITVILVGAGQQLSGLDVIYSYLVYIFSASGVAPGDMAYIAIGTGLCELLALLMSSYLIERLGRKPLLIGGYSMMALSCVIITISLSLQEYVHWMPFLSASCVFACILSFGIGPGCVTSLLPAEFFTQEARSGAYTLYGMSNWSFLFIIGMVFPFMVDGLGPFCFLFFLIDCVATAIFTFFFIPETKNRSFLEISSYFQRHSRKVYVEPECTELSRVNIRRT